jgi:hypothetical protein
VYRPEKLPLRLAGHRTFDEGNRFHATHVAAARGIKTGKGASGKEGYSRSCFHSEQPTLSFQLTHRAPFLPWKDLAPELLQKCILFHGRLPASWGRVDFPEKRDFRLLAFLQERKQDLVLVLDRQRTAIGNPSLSRDGSFSTAVLCSWVVSSAAQYSSRASACMRHSFFDLPVRENSPLSGSIAENH